VVVAVATEGRDARASTTAQALISPFTAGSRALNVGCGFPQLLILIDERMILRASVTREGEPK
jgi:hypothetical protein